MGGRGSIGVSGILWDINFISLSRKLTSTFSDRMLFIIIYMLVDGIGVSTIPKKSDGFKMVLYS